MKTLKCLAALVVSAACAGTALAQSSMVYGPPILLAQHRVVVRQAPPVPPPVQMQQRQRRFAMPPGGHAYPRAAPPRYAPPGAAVKEGRMSPEDRRALRRQINEANQGIYHSQRTRGPITKP